MISTITAVTDYAPCIALRRIVFMGEQGISEAEEMDDLDDQAIHLLAHDQNAPVGTARLLIDGEIGKIGRICVLLSHRGTGLGAALVTQSIAYLRQMPQVKSIKISAQDHAIHFYERLGFRAVGPYYDDAGIPHRDMIYAIEAPTPSITAPAS